MVTIMSPVERRILSLDNDRDLGLEVGWYGEGIRESIRAASKGWMAEDLQ
jgi:hypothetical protein